MTPQASTPAGPPLSRRTASLSEAETQAGLRAIHRVLVHGRALAHQGADHALLVDVFDAVEVLPLTLLRPAEFEDLFLPTLDGLAAKHPGFRGVRDEFAAAVGVEARRG